MDVVQSNQSVSELGTTLCEEFVQGCSIEYESLPLYRVDNHSLDVLMKRKWWNVQAVKRKLVADAKVLHSIHLFTLYRSLTGIRYS